MSDPEIFRNEVRADGNRRDVGPEVDPTKNVLDLVQAAVRRIDDLRLAENKRLEDLATSEREHVRELLALRASHSRELTVAEANRIDAIRAVDVNAVTVASERANQSAQVLAANVATSAETLRTLVSTSAMTLAQQLTQTITPITDRIALLEKAQYEGAGKERVTDPLVTQLLLEVRSLRDSQAQGTGAQGQKIEQRQSNAALYAVIGVVATLIFLTIAIAGFAMSFAGTR